MKYDEIGYWSEIKLEIIEKYAAAYSTILTNQKYPALYHVYIDAFAGAGQHISKTSGNMVLGSPLNALYVNPPFREYHLIDLNSEKIESLRNLTKKWPNVSIHEGDCNRLLINEIFPKVEYKDYRRALCLLDPYGLHLKWDVLKLAGKMKSIEIFLNFPVADMNRNVLRRDIEKVDAYQTVRLTDFWGDETWRHAAYDTTGNLFGFEEKQGNEAIVKAFQKRLKENAGFAYVPDPMPMRNSKNSVVYYLFFASQKPVAADIVKDIFEKYKNREGI